MQHVHYEVKVYVNCVVASFFLLFLLAGITPLLGRGSACVVAYCVYVYMPSDNNIELSFQILSHTFPIGLSFLKYMYEESILFCTLY